MHKSIVSIIVPVYNESEAIPLFLERIHQILQNETYCFEIIFINDGSVDSTMDVLKGAHVRDGRIKIIELSRNFGKELAMSAGFKAARGEAVIPMDVDLQDPPEIISEFLRKWEAGNDVVLGVRKLRAEDSYIKRKSASWFYVIFKWLCNGRMVSNAGDYRLMDRKVVDALNMLPERVRFTKGLYAWLGFTQACVEYNRPARVKGSTTWKLWGLWNFAIDGITSFSTLPLRIWSYLGIGIAICGFLYAIFVFIKTLLFGIDVPGYPSMMVVILVLGGLILTSLGIIGEYLGRIFIEVKCRPLYIIKSSLGFDHDSNKE